MVDSAKRLDTVRAVALVDALGRVQGKLAALVTDATASGALTPAEAVALRAVTTAPEGLSQSSWGRDLGVSRQRAHALAAGLAARGLLVVEPAGRASRVRVTPAGSAAVAAQVAQVGDAVSARLAGFAEADALLALLGRLSDVLG